MRENAERSYRPMVDESASDQRINEAAQEHKERGRLALTHDQLQAIYDDVALRVIKDGGSLTGTFREDRSGHRWSGYIYRSLEHFAVLRGDNKEMNKYSFAQEALQSINAVLQHTAVWENGKINYNVPDAAATLTAALQQVIVNIDELFDIIYPKKSKKNSADQPKPNNVIKLFP